MSDDRPFYIVKKLRVCDLHDDDVVLDWHPDIGSFWTRATSKVRRGLAGHSDPEGLTLVDVQVRERPGLTYIDYGDSPPVPVEADPAYRDALRGQTP